STRIYPGGQRRPRITTQSALQRTFKTYYYLPNTTKIITFIRTIIHDHVTHPFTYLDSFGMGHQKQAANHSQK
ncbi:MAG TPA: hypothetical protein VJ946_06720, partial [Bacteroidales bacterium]|nr:hypothetical protein [Bacteroidales bacterium]